MFTKAVPVGAFPHSAVVPSFLSKGEQKQMEVERTKKGDTVERFTTGVVNVNAPFSGAADSTEPKLTFDNVFINLQKSELKIKNMMHS